jgi:isopentenyl-diphosphate delta-isomerase
LETVILVDEHDNHIGTMEKMEAHRRGLLHRAFSAFIFDGTGGTGRLLLQQRTLGKYHNPGIWSNTACSHPREGESPAQAAERRLGEELGFSAPCREIASFTYRAEFPNGLVENEFDHVCIGFYDGQEIIPNPCEVAATRWVSRDELITEIAKAPEKFSYWLREIAARGILDDQFNQTLDTEGTRAI